MKVIKKFGKASTVYFNSDYGELLPKIGTSKHHSGVRRYPIVELTTIQKINYYVFDLDSQSMNQSNYYKIYLQQSYKSLPDFLSLSLLGSQNYHLRADKEDARNRVTQSRTERTEWINCQSEFYLRSTNMIRHGRTTSCVGCPFVC